ncbi:MAG TPA: AbrB/MazE/SpoVT family DNA-binding domain-containing protein [Ktedonobacteraceae bacterium]|nr:AbrB/MazE/SpoVT family DNA-binding domain-containing protein [Ktedonobacteraceae bacterium]
MNQPMPSSSQEARLKVLGEGIIALPKGWKDELGIEDGTVVKARKEGRKVIIEAQPIKPVLHRVYSDEEIDEFLEEDKIPEELAQGVQNKLSALYGL